MNIFEYRGIERLPLGRCAVALGFFDGVHLAHRELIRATISKARARGLAAVVFTFPSESDGIKGAAPRIYDTETKLELIEALGADAVVLADFGKISGLSPESFVREALVNDLSCELAVAGYNFRFGKGAKGTPELLCSEMAAMGLDAIIIEEYRTGSEALSSTGVREALALGSIPEANRMLGEPYRILGEVVHGNGRGESYGFPTVNTEPKRGFALPRIGVYRTLLPIDGRLYTGVTNVGKCPTFGERSVHAETYIVGYSGDLYGRKLKIYFLEYLREERRFESAEALKEQIDADVLLAIEKNKKDLDKINERKLD